MAALPANPTTTITPAEMQILVSRAGLVLNPGQVADLVLAWRQVAGLIAGLPNDRPLADDLAYTFRLAPPAAASGAPARPVAQAHGRAKPSAPARRATTKPPAKAKTAAKSNASATAKARARPKPARKPAPPTATRRR